MRGILTTRLVQTSILNDSLIQIDYAKYQIPVAIIHGHLKVAENNLTGWMDIPFEQNDEFLDAIQHLAYEIKTKADVLVVVGIGGSFLGAKAIQDALTPYFEQPESAIEVIYVGQNMSGTYINHLIRRLDNKDVYVNVISKSGTTMEPAIAFRVLRKYMEQRYGDESSKRIIVTTDEKKGLLKKIAMNAGYRQFVIPSNIGGRYSVLTPVGLLPIAVAGIDIYQLLEGARDAAYGLDTDNIQQNDAYRYAVIRHELYKSGYQIELLASFEPSLSQFHEWWKQLFAESEGKEKKGLYPSGVHFSTDLHSMGQFIQDGNPILFETILHFKTMKEDYRIPYDKNDEDELNFLANRSFNEINAISKEGVVSAHVEGGVPVIQLELETLDAYHLGYLVYFFMKACAMSAYLLKVNPFNQPGVEAYKAKILELLQKEKVYK